VEFFHLIQSSTNYSDIRLHVAAYPAKLVQYRLYSVYRSVAVCFANFIIVLCADLKLFSLSLLPLHQIKHGVAVTRHWLN